MAFRSFFDILTEAIGDFARNGFDSEERLSYWTERLRKAAEAMGTGAEAIDRLVKSALGAIYSRVTSEKQVFRRHPGVGRFTVEKVAPSLRAELDRRILASANLIRRNRVQAIEKTLQRFQGWATSIPAGGTKNPGRAETKAAVSKALKDLPFEERRVLIDQGHKLIASVDEVVAQGGGALALVWHSHWRQAGYNYRPDHKERDGKVYLLRNSWAIKCGLVKPGDAGWYDQVTAVAQEPFCRCQARYLYALRDLPDDMVTAKGREELERVRARMRGAV